MFERFTDRSRRVLVLAGEECRLLGHPAIGTEHLLLGLIDEGEGVAAQVLKNLSVSLDAARTGVEALCGVGKGSPGSPPFTPRAKKVLELALREALQLGHNYIGTEHMLLGLVREGEGVAAQVLVNLGADLTAVRQAVISVLLRYAKSSGSDHMSVTPTDATIADYWQSLRDRAALFGSRREELLRRAAELAEMVRMSRTGPGVWGMNAEDLINWIESTLVPAVDAANDAFRLPTLHEVRQTSAHPALFRIEFKAGRFQMVEADRIELDHGLASFFQGDRFVAAASLAEIVMITKSEPTEPTEPTEAA